MIALAKFILVLLLLVGAGTPLLQKALDRQVAFDSEAWKAHPTRRFRMSEDAVRQLVPGKTSAKDVFRLMGPPNRVHDTEEKFVKSVQEFRDASYSLGERPVFWDLHDYRLEIRFSEQLLVTSARVLGD